MNPQEQRTLNIVWIACIGAIFVYAIIVFMMRFAEGLGTPPALPERWWGTVHIVTAVLACITAIGALVVKAKLVDASPQDEIRRQGYVFSFALADAIGVYGLVLSFLTGAGLGLIAVFFGLSLILLLLVRPRTSV